jgi:hypothetical protein
MRFACFVFQGCPCAAAVQYDRLPHRSSLALESFAPVKILNPQPLEGDVRDSSQIGYSPKFPCNACFKRIASGLKFEAHHCRYGVPHNPSVEAKRNTAIVTSTKAVSNTAAMDASGYSSAACQPDC